MFSDAEKSQDSIPNILAFVFIPLILMALFITIFLIISKFLYLKGMDDHTVRINSLALVDFEQQQLEVLMA
uniref:Col_cuticle_N domain-containing protein n=1 Tax=Parastrongyloides trichosuri TaxID=131310 RepID=A0A0N4Z4P1_PARTI